MMAETRNSASKDAAAQALLQRLAVLGNFEPLEMLSSIKTDEERLDMLDVIGAGCIEVVEGDQVLWRLKDDVRRRVLSGLKTRRSFDNLRKTTRPRADDAFGRALQAALAGEAAGETAGDALYIAQNFATYAPFASRSAGKTLLSVRQDIVAEQQKKREDGVLPGPLFGRRAEMDLIMRFLRTGALPKREDTDAPAGFERFEGGRRRVPRLLVTGVGGIGKSALMAAVLREARESTHEMPVLIELDFDLPNLQRIDTLEVGRAITRRLGALVPALAQRLAACRNVGAQESGGGRLQRDEVLKAESQFLFLLHKALPRRNPGKRGFVLVLDTFEEVLAQGQQVVTDLLNWLDALAGEGGLTPLKILIVGRSAPEQMQDANGPLFSGSLELGNLEQAAAVDLLQYAAPDRFFEGARGEAAASCFGGHPLVLTMLARMERAEIDPLIEEAHNSPRLPPEFAQRFLYSRVLGRIRDRDVAQLAHPGLALRRVTPSLIRHVLAGPCGFETMDEDRAEALFARLAGSTWIVERTLNPRVVLHRRDLRNLMLPAMMNPKPDDAEGQRLKTLALGIHQAAYAWYAEQRDEYADAGEQLVEMFYHGALANEGFLPDMKILHAVAARFTLDDIAMFPGHLRTAIKSVKGQHGAISNAEIQALPSAYDEVVRSARESFDLSSNQTESLLSLNNIPPSSGEISGEKIFGAFPPLLPGGTGNDALPQLGRVVDYPDAPDISFSIPEMPQILPPAALSPATTLEEAERRHGKVINALWLEARYDKICAIGEEAYRFLWEQKKIQDREERNDDKIVKMGVWKYILSLFVTKKFPEYMSKSGAFIEWKIFCRDINKEPVYNNYAYIRLLGVIFSDLFKSNYYIIYNYDIDIINVANNYTNRTGIFLNLAMKNNYFAPRTAAPGVFRVFAWKKNNQLEAVNFSTFKALTSWTSTENKREVRFSRISKNSMRSTNLRSGLGCRLYDLDAPATLILSPLANNPQAMAAMAAVGRGLSFWPPKAEAEAEKAAKTVGGTRFLATLIDIADHAQLLPALFQAAMPFLEDPAPLRRLRKLYDALEENFNTGDLVVDETQF